MSSDSLLKEYGRDSGEVECAFEKPENDLAHNSRVSESSWRRQSKWTLLYIFVAIIVLVASFFAGVFSGDLLARHDHVPGTVNQVPVGNVQVTFHFNESFASPPPPTPGQTEPVWDSLIPDGLGYVQGVSLAPNFSVVSVFHQLHCLYTIRRALFSTTMGEEPEDFDFGKPRSEHAGHCFEYLRQSIMCSADSSIEPAGGEHDGLLGWGVSHQCRDFESLKAWAEGAKAFSAHGFFGEGTSTHAHGMSV